MCVPTWLWVAAASACCLLRSGFHLSTGIAGAQCQVKRFMRLLVIIYGLHICVFLLSLVGNIIATAAAVAVVVAVAISWPNEVC